LEVREGDRVIIHFRNPDFTVIDQIAAQWPSRFAALVLVALDPLRTCGSVAVGSSA
jgi:hypothetical protein